MIVGGHQADLLPYSGFWHKMAVSDVFDLKIYDQFQVRGYQRRVQMRETWASVPVVGNPRRARICDVRIVPEVARNELRNLLTGRYQGARHWDTWGPALLDLVESNGSEQLWQFNLHLILGVRDMLGIGTPVAIAPAPRGRKNEGLVDVMRRYGADTYLAGTGGRAYMGECEEFHDAGISVQWSAHRPVTGDSVVTLLMDYDDPLERVLATHEAAEVSA